MQPQRLIFESILLARLNKSFILYICFFCVWQSQSIAGNPAGIVLYLSSKDGVYLLLADHTGLSNRGWSAFGGRSEGDEFPAETAARETEEETRGCFSREILLQKIMNKIPVVDGEFHMFFVEIDFIPAQRVTNNILTDKGFRYKERGPYAWIPYSEVRKHLLNRSNKGKYVIDKRFLPKNVKRNWFWTVWIHNMHEAFQRGLIPWKDMNRNTD